MFKISKILLLILIVFSIKCSNEKLIFQKEPNFTVSEKYYQKLIPGQKDMPLTIKLSLEISNASENLLIDSVFFNGEFLSVSIQSINHKLYLESTTDKTKLSNQIFNHINLKQNEAIIFYSLQNKKYYFKVENLKSLAPLYLP